MGSAHDGRRWAVASSTLIRRPPQQLEKTWSILSIKTWLCYKNGVFDVKTTHHCLMSGQDPDVLCHIKTESMTDFENFILSTQCNLI